MTCKIHGPDCKGHASRARVERPVLEAAEVRLLLDGCAKGEERAAFLVMYDAALRSKELSLLTWACIDFERRLAVVPRTAKGRDRSGAIKAARVVEIPLTQTTCEAIAALPRTGPGPFPLARWNARAYQEWFRHLCAKAGVARSKAYSHVLRASRATHLYEAGADVKEIQRQLGHWSEATTWIYLHMTDDRKRLAARRAESVMDGILREE